MIDTHRRHRTRQRLLAALVGIACATALAVAPPADAQQVELTRLAGANRIETAVAVSRATFPTDHGANVVVLARADDPADSYAATPYPTYRSGPVLLTGTDSLPAETLAEIRRVLPSGGTVVLAGGTAAISDAVAEEVRSAGYAVDRVGGATRFETAARLATDTRSDPPVVFVADGGDFRFALPAAAMAAQTQGVVVLSDGARMPSATAGYLATYAEGTPVHAVGDAAVAALGTRATVTYPGTDPSAVSVALVEHFFTNYESAQDAITIASVADFPDALTGGVFAATSAAPLVLTPPEQLAASIDEAIRRYPVTRIVILGGTAAVPEHIATAAHAAATGQPPPGSPPPEPTNPAMDQARVIPGAIAYAYDECPPPPDSPLIPDDATCVTVIATDLDGDGTEPEQLDRLIMYQQDTGEFIDRLTIAAYTTTDGALTPHTAETYVPDPQDGQAISGYGTECIVNLDPHTANDVLVTTTIGANTLFGHILSARDGAVRPLTQAGHSEPFEWASGGGVRYGIGFEIRGDILMVATYDDETGKPYGWTQTDYRVAAGTATYVDSRSGSTSDPGRYIGNGCPTGSNTFQY